jgi:hypothetical protein
MDAELLRQENERLKARLAEQNAAGFAWNGHMVHGDKASVQAVVDALSVAQGQGFVMVPRGNIEALIRELESPVGCYTGAIAKKLRYLLAAAPAQPDGVE